jgi:chorismate-pyruvate lyase
VKAAKRSAVELEFLVKLFYPSAEALGEFEEVDEEDLPPVYQGLLAHDQHMTETVEAYHGSPVDVRVLKSCLTATHYQRNSLLTRQSDGHVVLFAVMRAALSLLAPEVRQELQSEGTPLGRILIRRNVMRSVRLLSLWKVRPSSVLCWLFGLGEPDLCYGRTALIYCDAVPVMELLEIVTAD